MKLGPNTKPHRDLAGYVCEMKAKLGGHIVIFDRENGASDIDADERWIVMHMPSTQHIAVQSQAIARDVMKGVAKSTTINEACRYADILPRRAENGAAADDEGAEITERNERRHRKADAYTDKQRDADLDRFMADPENEPSPEGKAALHRLFGRDDRE